MSIYDEDSQRGYEKYRRKQKRNRRLIITLLSTLAILAAIFLLIHVVNGVSDSLNARIEKQATTVPEEDKTNKKKEEEVKVTFMATGDNLIHNNIYGQAATGDGYDFSKFYAEIKPLIASVDLAFVNQETPVATSVFEPSGYPLFNTPSETVTALHEAGFNLFNLASNHTLDKGVKGMEATLNFMEAVPDSTIFGLYRNYTDTHTPRLVAVKGITFAFIGVTEMTNGIPMPTDTEFDIVYTSETEKIQTMIDESKAKSDVVVLSAHWGDENVLKQDVRQEEMAKEYANMGADLIIGHHPHVLQEIEIITTDDGRQVPVVYSLGNLISAMTKKANHVGGFFGCDIVRRGETITIENLSFTPVINYFTSGYRNMRVIPFASYTAEMAASHGLGLSLGEVNSILDETVGRDLLVNTNSQ